MKQNIKKKTLTNIRIDEKDYSNMVSAIEKFNENNFVKLDMIGFRRYAIVLLAQTILQDKPLNLQFK